jgi:putative acyl-CoA dehydrogenase
MAFQQEDFNYHNLYTENSYLQDVLKAYASPESLAEIENDLASFGERARGEILQLMWRAERNPPELVSYDHWGRRIDHIEVDPAWEELHRVAAREGIVATGYERQSGASSRLHQFLKLMIFHPSSAFYSCPLAMTDGAARVLELENGPLKSQYFSRLISRDPETFWTAGQWMTEKAGGSDVSQSETLAELKEGRYFLTGTKWFTSAITANMAMALAQTNIDGKARLSLFLIRIRDDQGRLNNIEVLRLKDKLGTKAMPTAELRLNGTEGFLVGELGQGVKTITTILNISRLYNSVCATGTIYRLHSLIRDYSKKRFAFGKMLIDHSLHQETLLKTQADTNGCVHFIACLGGLLGKSETAEASEIEQAVLRLMTPVAKLWTGKKSVQTTSELIEAFGGAGYIEDTHLPRFLRDAQVFSIWEGTTNIMSLDVLRAMSQGPIFKQSMSYINEILNQSPHSSEKAFLDNMMKDIMTWVQKNQNQPSLLERAARQLSFALGDLFVGVLLLHFAQNTKKIRDQHLVQVFVENIQSPQFIENEGRHERNLETLLS